MKRGEKEGDWQVRPASHYENEKIIKKSLTTVERCVIENL